MSYESHFSHPRNRIASLLRRSLRATIVAGWLCLIVFGFAIWESFETLPGPIGQTVSTPSPDIPSSRWVIQIFLHPHCPCSKASVRQLAELLERTPTQPEIRIWFVRPSKAPQNWEQTALNRYAKVWFGKSVYCDHGGVEARRYGALTSGTLVLHDPKGRMMYHGGITRGRGMVGDSDGTRALKSLLDGTRQTAQSFPVFGCPLLDRYQIIDELEEPRCR